MSPHIEVAARSGDCSRSRSARAWPKPRKRSSTAPFDIDATGCATIKTALTSAYPGGIDTGYDGTQGTVDLKTVDLFQYSVVVVPSLADDSTAPYALLRDATVASKLKAALLGRRAFWSGTPDQGVVSTTRPQKDALIQNLAAWASGDFATVNAPGLVVLQDNSTRPHEALRLGAGDHRLRARRRYASSRRTAPSAR